MIYTLTLNPALDYTLEVPRFRVGTVNRTEDAQVCAGGKGINVSIILHNLGTESVALGFVAGFTGQEIEQLMENIGVRTDFIRLDSGLSRINVSINADAETKINASGPKIPADALQKLFCRLDALEEGDALVLSGALPSGVPDDFYGEIMRRLAAKKLRVVVDAGGEQLISALKYRPLLIKPNQCELGELFGTSVETRGDVIFHAKKLREMGAQNVLVSMGGEGAILLTDGGEILEKAAPKGILVNSVGAGDSMVAGFLAEFLRCGSLERALAFGIAAGSATAFSGWLAKKEEILAEFAKFYCN